MRSGVLCATYASMQTPDPKEIRAKLNLTQVEFALRYHLPYRTVQGWESGRRPTRGMAVWALKLIEKAPDLVAETLADPAPSKRRRPKKPQSPS